MSSSSTTNPSNPSAANNKPRKGIDADALLRSLAPVVAKPESGGHPNGSGGGAERNQSRPEPADDVEAEPRPVIERPRRARSKADESGFDAKAVSSRARATLDVEINPGEGSTAIYVRVPRTTHVALKLLALQNQAAMDGPTELASIVRTAIGEYLDRQDRRRERAA